MPGGQTYAPNTSGSYVYEINQGTYSDFSFSVPDLTPERDDLAFSGWSQSSSGTSVEYEADRTYKQQSEFKPGKTLDLYAVWEQIHVHSYGTAQQAHPHKQMCKCGSYVTHYDSNCQICTNRDAITIVDGIGCESTITIKPNEPLYRSIVPDDHLYSYGNKTVTLRSRLYWILSTGEKRYSIESDFYVSEFSLSEIQVLHSFKEEYEGSSLEHPHRLKCGCGTFSYQDLDDCFACYPAVITYRANDGTSNSAVQEINTGRYDSAGIARNTYDWTRNGYTLLGWSEDPRKRRFRTCGGGEALRHTPLYAEPGEMYRRGAVFIHTAHGATD